MTKSSGNMESDFDSAKYEVQCMVGDFEKDELKDCLENMWYLSTRSDDARRILLPIIEAVNKANNVMERCKIAVQDFEDVEYDELNIPFVDDEDGYDGE